MIYLSLVLATTLMCTLLIVYRILSVRGIKTGLRSYHGVVEVVVESAALYSAALIVYMAFVSRNTLGSTYLDVIMGSIKVGFLLELGSELINWISRALPPLLLSVVSPPGMHARMTHGRRAVCHRFASAILSVLR